MSTLMTTLISLSLAALFIVAVYRANKNHTWRRFALQMIPLAVGIWFLNKHFGFPSFDTLQSRGPDDNDEIFFLIILYGSMILGMGCHYLYDRFDQPKHKRKEFDLGLFIAPVLISPIIFIPLFGALQNVDVDMDQLNSSIMMTFFVAFENGFFWKAYFDAKRKERGDENTEPDGS